jgi:integrase
MNSFEVRIWDIGKRTIRGRLWYRVRWKVAGAPKPFEELFAKKALASAFRSELETAANKGRPFDIQTGRPVSDARSRNATTYYAHARVCVAKKWPRLAAKSRRSMVEALTDATLELTRKGVRGAPDASVLRTAVYHYGLNPRRWDEPIPDEVAVALTWLEKASSPVHELESLQVVRRVLDGFCVRLDGREAAATTVARKRAAFYNSLGFAVEAGLLESNPIDRIQWTAPEVARAIDRRVVANPTQVRAMLDALRGRGARARRMVAFFGGIYFTGGRPSEVADLHPWDCIFPAACRACGFESKDILNESASCCDDLNLDFGWGVVTFVETDPRAGTSFTDDGRPNQRRGLKHRARKDARPVPAPPEYGALLHAHIQEFRPAPDGRLFYGIHGGPLSESVWDRWWKIARELALTATQVVSPLARRAYDLRHAAASLWLNAGVPATEVARRLGHSVRVLLTVYANCIDGGDDGFNERIGSALA